MQRRGFPHFPASCCSSTENSCSRVQVSCSGIAPSSKTPASPQPIFFGPPNTCKSSFDWLQHMAFRCDTRYNLFAFSASATPKISRKLGWMRIFWTSIQQVAYVLGVHRVLMPQRGSFSPVRGFTKTLFTTQLDRSSISYWESNLQ